MAELDLLIRNGRVFDGTGNPWYWADLGVKDGRIVALGRPETNAAARVIDAAGLAVAPGFIDMHTHSDIPLVVDGTAQSKVRQGVTLDVIGEKGSVGPLRGPAAEEYRHEQRHRFGFEVDWQNLPGYFARLERQGIS